MGSAPTAGPDAQRGASVRTTERLKAFTDAVVAIALTLLILPLLERIPEAADGRLSTADFLGDNLDPLLSFLLSFVIIATFWLAHHRLYDHIAVPSSGVVWLTVGWMLTIVWLPVPTAMVGALPTDRLQILLYVGTMLVTCLLALSTHLLLRRHPELWEESNPPDPEALRSSVVICVLFTLALVIGLAAPGVGYYGLMLLLMAPVLRRVVSSRGGS
jgi:uncharacterized membrane protein